MWISQQQITFRIIKPPCPLAPYPFYRKGVRGRGLFRVVFDALPPNHDLPPRGIQGARGLQFAPPFRINIALAWTSSQTTQPCSMGLMISDKTSAPINLSG